MNYFTHSTPKSWKIDARANTFFPDVSAHRPSWLQQCSGLKTSRKSLSSTSIAAQLPGAVQLIQLENLGHLQIAWLGMERVVNLRQA